MKLVGLPIGGILGYRPRVGYHQDMNMATAPRNKYAYTRAPESAEYGDMAPELFEELKNSIRESGLLTPIMTRGREIVDGWHRYTACQEVGYEFDPDDFVPWEPQTDNPEQELSDLLADLNLLRRQLTPEETIRMMVEKFDYKPGTGPKRTSLGDIAKAAGVSVSTVQRTLKKGSKAEKPAPTLESLQRMRKMVAGRLASIDAQIAELQSIAKPKAPPRPVARRR